MNWILIVVLAILAGCGYAGWKKGVIRIVLSLTMMIVTILATVFAAPVVGKIVKEKTTLYDSLYQSVSQAVESGPLLGNAEQKVKTQLDENEQLSDELENVEDSDVQKYADRIISVLNLPESIASQVETVINTDYVEQIRNEGGAAVRSVIVTAVAQRMTDIIFNTVIHIIVFAVVFAVLRLVVSVTGIISMLPVIHQANKVLGLAVGLLEGILFVWVFFVLLTAFGSQSWAAQALADIGNSRFLSFLYDNNYILKSVFRSL